MNEETLRVLAPFLDEAGRLIRYPAKQEKKRHALAYLAGKFAPDTVYTELQVNELLEQWHTVHDPATLRQKLYNHRFLNRTDDCREYRRCAVLPAVEDPE